MKLTRSEAKMLLAFRRSPYASELKALLDRELTEKRYKYEQTMAEETTRAYILAVRSVQEILFTQPVQVENAHV